MSSRPCDVILVKDVMLRCAHSQSRNLHLFNVQYLQAKKGQRISIGPVNQ